MITYETNRIPTDQLIFEGCLLIGVFLVLSYHFSFSFSLHRHFRFRFSYRFGRIFVLVLTFLYVNVVRLMMTL